MIDKTKILGYILYGKYCGVKSPTVVKKKKKVNRHVLIPDYMRTGCILSSRR